MATKYKFGMIEKHQGDNNTPRRMKLAKNGEDCYRWYMTTLYVSSVVNTQKRKW